VFTLTTQQSRIAHINVREEKHGEESVPAVDLTIVCDVPNGFLSYLHPTLKASLYGPQHTQSNLIDDAGHLPCLLYNALPELKWVGAMDKATVVLHGVKPKDNIELEAGIDKLVLMPKDGGTVEIKFRVSSRPGAAIIGRLVALLGLDMKVSVTANPDDQGGGDLTDGGDGA